MSLLDPTRWLRVVVLTVTGTLFCVTVAVYVDSYKYGSLTPEQVRQSLTASVLVPIGLAAPLLLLTLTSMRRLALAKREIEKIAATDTLTSVMSRGAFTMLVEAYLDDAGKRAQLRQGALLMVDVDHFKSINDSFGHDLGDSALKMIARAIVGAVRIGDLVGRMGGEEFGVFLPGANLAQAKVVAERIRAAISTAEFNPTGARYPLSASLGGVVFSDRVTFQKLYTFADEKLYVSKHTGRNRVTLAPLVVAPMAG